MAEEISPGRRLARAARDKLLAERAGDPNVIGAGYGMRRRGGETTDEPVLGVYVVRKKRPEDLSPSELLPTEVETDLGTIAVDVVQTGVVRALGG